MVEDDSDKKACACTQRQRDLSRATQPAKEPSLIKTTCDHCRRCFGRILKGHTVSTVKSKERNKVGR